MVVEREINHIGNMNFKTQISTTREQSEKLLALGVKPETADMYIDKHGQPCCLPYSRMDGHREQTELCPAWSLGRLIDMVPDCIRQVTANDLYFQITPEPDYCFVDYVDYEAEYRNVVSEEGSNIFDVIIRMIGWLIENEYFKEKYLINK